MTIDAAKFEPQGKPTVDQVLEVYNEHNKPSYRELEKILKGRGFDISYRSLQRWVENAKAGTLALSHATKIKEVKKEINEAVADIPQKELEEADDRAYQFRPKPRLEDDRSRESRMSAQHAVQAEVEIIDTRIKELMMKSEAELDVTEQKARKIFNTVLMEAAARRAHVLVLIPKETGALVEAMTEASKQTLTGGIDQPPKNGDPKVIDGEFEAEPEEQSGLASQISKFLHTEGLT